MTGHWQWLPLWLGAGCVVVGWVIIVALFVGSGEQVSSVTQLPYVLVAGGAGVGSIVFGAALWNAQRRRLEQQHVEDALARMLHAAATLARARGIAPSVADQGGRL